MFIDSGKVIST